MDGDGIDDLWMPTAFATSSTHEADQNLWSGALLQDTPGFADSTIGYSEAILQQMEDSATRLYYSLRPQKDLDGDGWPDLVFSAQVTEYSSSPSSTAWFVDGAQWHSVLEEDRPLHYSSAANHGIKMRMTGPRTYYSNRLEVVPTDGADGTELLVSSDWNRRVWTIAWADLPLEDTGEIIDMGTHPDIFVPWIDSSSDMAARDDNNGQIFGDIDGDGIEDAAQIAVFDTGGTVRIFLAASRTGEFITPEDADGVLVAERDEDGFAEGSAHKSNTVIADFNGDGYADIAVGAHQEDFDSTGTVYLFSGEDLGDGELSAADAFGTLETDVPGAEAVNHLWLGQDLDHDGSPDLMVFGDLSTDSSLGGAMRIFSGADLLTGGVRDILSPDSEWTIPEEDWDCASTTLVSAANMIPANVGDLNEDGWDDMMVGTKFCKQKAWIFTGIDY